MPSITSSRLGEGASATVMVPRTASRVTRFTAPVAVSRISRPPTSLCGTTCQDDEGIVNVYATPVALPSRIRIAVTTLLIGSRVMMSSTPSPSKSVLATTLSSLPSARSVSLAVKVIPSRDHTRILRSASIQIRSPLASPFVSPTAANCQPSGTLATVTTRPRGV